MDNTTIRDCVQGFIGGPKGDFKTTATITNCHFLSDGVGARPSSMHASGSGSSDMTLADCVLAGNSLAAISVEGAAATARVDHCRIVGNAVGVGHASGNGTLLTLGNNTLSDNGIDGTFGGTIALK